MKKERYIIIDESRGVFLGSYSTSIFDNQPELDNDIYDTDDKIKIYSLFANNNPFEVAYAPTFDSLKDANGYIKKYMTNLKFGNLYAVAVETEDDYASLVEIIKSGHEKHTYNMLNTLFQKTSILH